MKIETLRDLYSEQLRDLYSAELQLIRALPEMAKAASSEDLKAAFEEHLNKTRDHARRIETIFEQMGGTAKGKECRAMEGLVNEGGQVMEEDMADVIKDAALIAAAQRVEHYEIAGYGCVHAYANRLGDDCAADLLSRTLAEEKQADVLLNRIAEQLNLDITEKSDDAAKRSARMPARRSAA
jgi:ferritin-like metal-binding protein YciE